jgi:hypothetical protein
MHLNATHYLDIQLEYVPEARPDIARLFAVKKCAVYPLSVLRTIMGRDGGTEILQQTLKDSDAIRAAGGVGIAFVRLSCAETIFLTKVMCVGPVIDNSYVGDMGDDWEKTLKGIIAGEIRAVSHPQA